MTCVGKTSSTPDCNFAIRHVLDMDDPHEGRKELVPSMTDVVVVHLATIAPESPHSGQPVVRLGFFGFGQWSFRVETGREQQ